MIVLALAIVGFVVARLQKIRSRKSAAAQSESAMKQTESEAQKISEEHDAGEQSSEQTVADDKDAPVSVE